MGLSGLGLIPPRLLVAARTLPGARFTAHRSWRFRSSDAPDGHRAALIHEV